MNEEKTTDPLFKILQKKIILILRNGKKYEGVWVHEHHNYEYLYNFSKIVIKQISEFDDMSHSHVENKINYTIQEILKWVVTDYKNEAWEKNREAKKWQKRKEGTNIMTCKERNSITSKNKSDEFYKKVEVGYNKCIEAKIKPTIAKIVEITGVSKNTVNKHLKIIKVNKLISE